MKFIHLSDLHLGKSVNDYSMIGDQKHILDEILHIVDEEKPRGVVIAGDVYDKPVPPIEAVRLFDYFLTRLVEENLEVFVISGNHDSVDRLSFGAYIMEQKNVHFAPAYDGTVKCRSVFDEYGEVRFYLLPFVKPAPVARYAEGEEIVTYTDAVRAAVEKMRVDPAVRNVLVAHQFVTGATRSESEISVGGLDNVDASAVSCFDYVALGHLHRPQFCGERIRYCGTPLKYSFSEVDDEKSVTVVEMGEKGSVTVRTVPLVPLRDMKEIRGSYDEVTRRSFYENTSYREDYMLVTLTDEEDIPDAIGKLRSVYTNLMRLDYDNTRTRTNAHVDGAENAENKSPLELFEELYYRQNNQNLTEEQRAFLMREIEKIWEEEE